MTIASYAADNDVDLVCMGTLGRKRIKGFLLGNTCERGLRATTCSLQTVHP